MAYSHYDRLTALDESFLALEDGSVHMHVGSVGIFEGGPEFEGQGGVDIERIEGLAEAALRRSPRFRQRLEYIPLIGDPVWVDDPHFNLTYHLRHTSLPSPGDERQLKRLAGRIMSQRLDRTKPLWEMWFVEGLLEDRFAVITKIHHCMIDGISGADLMSAFMGRDPDHRPEVVESQWVPRPRPTGATLFLDELARRASAPLRLLGSSGQLLRSPISSMRELSDALQSIGSALGDALSSASATPLNEPIGPHRRFDWLAMDIEDVKEVKTANECTLNDVVLATVSLATRSFMQRRSIDPGNLDFRTMVPVSIRHEDEKGSLGNRVAFLTVPLPIEEADPKRCLAQVSSTTKELKSSSRVAGTELIEQLSDEFATGLIGRLSRLAAASRPYNMVVTNVPGPQATAYLMGSRLLASYPLVPLFSNQALGVALFSYDGGLYWGFNADWESVPDLHAFVEAIQEAFESLRKM
jgi:WS/DGAT/MGAT family acyltransferase